MALDIYRWSLYMKVKENDRKNTGELLSQVA